ncbi:MAG TPA: DNA recombination protein RmuC, partial [Oxalobacteraceae bacterium]|nr:DNA recombination protein RmuC [Oxalobacteraceae bacterium]
MTTSEIIILLLVAVVLILQVIGLLRGRAADVPAELTQLQTALQQHQQQTGERIERELREQVQSTAQGTRQELTGNFAQFQLTLGAQLEAMRQAMTLQAQNGREEQASALKRFGDTINQSLTTLTESNAQRMAEVRAT